MRLECSFPFAMGTNRRRTGEEHGWEIHYVYRNFPLDSQRTMDLRREVQCRPSFDCWAWIHSDCEELPARAAFSFPLPAMVWTCIVFEGFYVKGRPLSWGTTGTWANLEEEGPWTPASEGDTGALVPSPCHCCQQLSSFAPSHIPYPDVLRSLSPKAMGPTDHRGEILKPWVQRHLSP